MKITPRLDIDNDIENMASGSLCQASNVLVNATNDAILTENSIVEMFHLEEGEQIVGKVSASNEFVIFTSANRIIRVKESDETPVVIQTNWRWGGGEVIGCYTYNVKNEMIVAISERISYDESIVPIKVINLDNPDYTPGHDDSHYSIAPNLPQFNITSFKFNGSSSILKGMYTFFIRFKKGEDYTGWFPIGYPIQCTNQDYAFNSYVGYSGQMFRCTKVYGDKTDSDSRYFCNRFSYSLSDTTDDTSERVSYNIILTLLITITDIQYEKYQLGYIVTTPNNETKTFTTADYNINATEAIIDCVERDAVTVDELTLTWANIYNAHTICAYGNRVYAAHYWEENPNIDVPNIDVSGITVKAVENDIFKNDIGAEEEETLKNKIIAKANTQPAKTKAPRVNNTEQTTSFDKFEKGYNYLVELSVVYPISVDNKVTCNIKLNCNRLNSDGGLIISTNDILNACAVVSGAKVVNTGIVIKQNTGDAINIGGFIVIKDGESYNIYPFAADAGTLIYPNSNSDTGDYDYYNPFETIPNATWNDFYISKSNPVSINKNDASCDINFVIPKEDNDGDIYVTRITRFKNNNGLKDINATILYNNKLAIGNESAANYTELICKGICSGNTSRMPYENRLLRTDGQYYYVGAHSWNIAEQSTFVIDSIRLQYPTDDYELAFYEYVVDESNNHITYNDSYLFEYANHDIRLGYDNIEKKFYLFLVGADNAVYKLDPFFRVHQISTDTNAHVDIAYIFAVVNESKIGTTVDDINNYYGNKSIYNWSNDREPGASDFDPDVPLNGKYVIGAKDTVQPDTFIYKQNNLSPIAIGYHNLTDKGDGTYTVDKDFAILIRLKDIFDRDNTGRKIGRLIYNLPESQTAYVYYNGGSYSGKAGRFYYVFTKSDTIFVDGEMKYNGKLCYLRDDCELNDEVPVFDYICSYKDIPTTSSADATHYAIFSWDSNPSAIPFYVGANVYTDILSEKSIDTLTNFTSTAEYTKTAINYAVYNFYIHYVLPDGNFTDGIKINNTATYRLTLPLADGLTYSCNEFTTIGEIKQYCNDNGLSDESNWNDNYRVNTYFAIDDNCRICNIFPQFNNDGIALYINGNGEKFFRGTYDYIFGEGIKPIKFVFDNIPEPEGYVGYFITYEKPEHILLGRGPILGYQTVEPFVPIYDETTKQTESYATYPLDLQSSKYSNKFVSAKVYYPEFSITKKGLGATQLIIENKSYGGVVDRGVHLKYGWTVTADRVNDYSNGRTVGIIENKILIPNDPTNNGGKEGCLLVTFANGIDDAIQLDQIVEFKEDWHWAPGADVEAFEYWDGKDAGLGNTFQEYIDSFKRYEDSQYNEFCFAIVLKITSNIYNTRNKELIPLGFTKYYDNSGQYGYEDFRFNYDYFYNNKVPIYTYNRYGCVYNEANVIPKFFIQGTETSNKLPYEFQQTSSVYVMPSGSNIYTRNYNPENYEYMENDRGGKAPIFRVVFASYNDFDMSSVQVDYNPIDHYYNIQNERNAGFHFADQDIASVYTKYIYPQYVNQLYKLPSCYNIYSGKLYTNYDSTAFANQLQFYGNTIRRSDVMQDESIRNAWRSWRIDNYKMISENKGLIYNVVGVGSYLICHTEHSLFVFDRSNQLDAENKTVQTLMPDAFDIDYTEVFTVDKGYAGLQDFNHWTISDYGYVFLDKDSCKVYRWDDNKLNEITNGMMNIFKFIDDIVIATEEQNNRFIVMCKTTLPSPNRLTISYNLPNEEWISSHSYFYDDMFNTKSNIYFINKQGTNSILKYDENSYNNYINYLTDNTNYFKTELIDGKPASFIDIVFSTNGVDKVLDYITYRINKATDDLYSGNKLLIYTNLCYTDYKDISTPRRRVDDWKNPVYRFGIWVVNWFRNMIKPIETIHPIIRGNGKDNPNRGELGRQVNNNALVVGKFWVVRLIFRDDIKRISIDDVQTY